jgi:ubiquinone/menaquinone biosynthesis C-methylase UbiE
MSILRKIGMQFKKPVGIPGMIISNMMIIENRSAYVNIIGDLMIQASDKILEIGYGPGVGISLVSNTTKAVEIYGVDYSELMFRRASKRIIRFIKNDRVHLMFGDFVETELNTTGFDKIFCINVVYFWDDLQRPFKKVNLLLKDNGTFCIYMAGKEELNKDKITKNGIFNKYTIEQMLNALKSEGFNDVNYYFKKGYYIKARK